MNADILHLQELFLYQLSCSFYKTLWKKKAKRIASWEAQENIDFVLLVAGSLVDFRPSYLCLHFSAFQVNIILVYLSHIPVL